MSELRNNAHFAMRRREGMAQAKADRILSAVNQENDWYWTCPRCKNTLRGTVAEISEGCDCGKTGKA